MYIAIGVAQGIVVKMIRTWILDELRSRGISKEDICILEYRIYADEEITLSIGVNKKHEELADTLSNLIRDIQNTLRVRRTEDLKETIYPIFRKVFSEQSSVLSKKSFKIYDTTLDAEEFMPYLNREALALKLQV